MMLGCAGIPIAATCRKPAAVCTTASSRVGSPQDANDYIIYDQKATGKFFYDDDGNGAGHAACSPLS